MSLLIKALDKAEKDQAKNSNAGKIEPSELSADWSLETIDEVPSSESHQVSSADANRNEIGLAGYNDSTLLSANQSHLADNRSTLSHNRTSKIRSQQAQSVQNQSRLNQQVQAANVFLAKRFDSTNDAKKIAFVSFVSLFALLLIGTGLYSYYYNKLVLPAKSNFIPTIPQTPPVVLPAATAPLNQPDANQLPIIGTENTLNTTLSSNTLVAESKDKKNVPLKSKIKTIDNGNVMLDPPSKFKTSHQVTNSPTAQKNSLYILSSSSSLVTITRNQSEAVVNPSLLSAYKAYTAGENAKAQQLYKQILQSEIRNTDAMLGLAAIAQRQNRIDDAVGWYKRVLEFDPKNTIAQSSLINAQLDSGGQGDPNASESRLKNLLAQQPENANLQATLGNFYADQNDWQSAQKAYFEAHRLAPKNADYTFNLAASLDQMGKPKLALPYYKRAIELLPTAGNTSISESVISARIKAIE